MQIKVTKISGKPFKSGLKINTVKSTTINPNTNKEAYTFYEDDSIVDKWKVKEIEYLSTSQINVNSR